MARKRFETPEDSGGIGGEDVAGKAADGDVGFQEFGVVVSDGFFVRGYNAIIAAGERAGPGFVRSELFVVIEDLARQGEQSLEGFTLRQAGGFEHLHARLFESEDQSGGERSRRVVERFFLGGDVHGDAAEGTRDGAGNTDGGGVAFDRKDFPLERWNADAVEGLHRVHGSGERSDGAHWFQGGRVTSSAGVENDFPAELLSADAGELCGNFRNFVIGDTYEDRSGGEGVVGDAGDRLTGSDEFGGFAGGGFGLSGDDENAPSAFVQEAAQRAPHAASTENGQAL